MVLFFFMSGAQFLDLCWAMREIEFINSEFD